MAVLSLMVHIIIYEKKVNTGVVLAAFPTTYDKWEDADNAAKNVAMNFKCRAWVAAIERPKLIVSVK